MIKFQQISSFTAAIAFRRKVSVGEFGKDPRKQDSPMDL
ncbi:hypothetical protein COO91_01306 [Nostoc flagelliforme CCNUN1]|uniref:Uncharacterized protein n=1 Tax=Nostoc flagelliforme CCNUN1 TaxID=2038116 RepID=A0A2K8SIX2_9NOSO|nr:hypothetical protein COO91_01306 [Nostoc flagelliforme CCNUN1]